MQNTKPKKPNGRVYSKVAVEVMYQADKYIIELVDLENAEWVKTDEDGYVYTEVYVSGKSWRVYAEYQELDNGEFEYSIVDYEYLDEHPRN